MAKIAIVGDGRLGQAVRRAAERRGNEALILSRRTGTDVLRPETLRPLAGVDAFVEATDIFTQKAETAREFFTTSTRTVSRWARASDSARHVLVSIVNCEVEEMAGNGYYAGKAAQEAAAREEDGGVQLVRSTLWFEFARQNLERMRVGPFGIVPQMRVRPVALESVADAVVDAAEGVRLTAMRDVCGPEEMTLWEMTRALDNKGCLPVSVPAPGRAGRAMRDGVLIPSSNAEVIGPAFSRWLAEGRR